MGRIRVFEELKKLEDEIHYGVLDIELVLNDVLFGEGLEHRELPVEYQLSKEQFARYEDFIVTVIGAIKSRGFTIIDEYQNSESYYYYIQFTPEFYDGTEPLIIYDVKFRLSEHPMVNKSSDSKSPKTNRVPIFRSFVVNGVEHNSIISTMNEIVNILNDLHAGDYESLMSNDESESNEVESDK